MTESKTPDELLKEEGNQLFSKSHFVEAISKYTESIKINPKNAISFCNRAYANLKIENFGNVIEDATKSIELDPSHVKGYYHRASAYLAISQHEKALSDLQSVHKERFF